MHAPKPSILNRRDCVMLGAASLAVPSCVSLRRDEKNIVVNDVHAQLNATSVTRIIRPTNLDTLSNALRLANVDGASIAVSGSRHAMGGQQFAADSLLLDMRTMNRIHSLDPVAGIVEVDAGIEWPELIDGLCTLHRGQLQRGELQTWSIIQKQTGADRLTLGGALAANAHGRGLTLGPMIQDVESFTLIDASGAALQCSRTDNSELFRLAIGGYGLFGVIARVKLRLARRTKIRRVVELRNMNDIAEAFEQRISEGYTYGDFQFSTDDRSDDYLSHGVFSCYQPVPINTPAPADQRALSAEDWTGLISLGHIDKARAFDAYAEYYLSTSGQIYWSDTHQLSTYVDDYHHVIDEAMGATVRASEMITEIYVPRASLAEFMAQTRDDFRTHDVNVIYGTVRLIERDEESVLAWAREPWACIIFNLHVVHDAAGLAKAEVDFRRLIDRAIERGGCYYLTYHRWAERAQIETCYPNFAEFLRLKRFHDPGERFQSEWYRHYREMFASEVAYSERAD
jgi:FAD/FMN-containing dehydrogenase